MKSYAQIYADKKSIKLNNSLNQSRKSQKNSINTYHSNIIQNSYNILAERNPSKITFSNFDNIQNLSYRLSENNTLTQENTKKNDNKTLVNKIDISNIKNIPIIDLEKDEIQNRTLNSELKHNENSLNFLEDDDDLVNIKKEEGKEKLIKKMIEKEKKFEKDNNKCKGIEIKNLNFYNLTESKNKEKNNSKINNKESSSIKYKNKKSTNQVNIKKNNKNNKNKINNNINYNNFNDEEISIRSEGSNNVTYEIKYDKKNVNNKENKINLVEETKEKQLTKEEILYSTHIIFLNNASFIKKQNKYMMSKSNFLNIMKTLNLISTQLILVEIDLLFDSFSTKFKMITYSQFNQILMKIIQILYPEKYKISPKLTMNYFLNKLINEYNLFFENKIPKDYLYKYQYNSIVKILQIMPDENQIFIMNDIYLIVNEIYSKYFRYEINYNHRMMYKSSENLIEFCKDFEIIPQTINQTQAMTYYNLSIHINEGYNIFNNEIKKYQNFKNKGIIFTLVHFMLFIIHISLYSYTKIFGSKKWTYDLNDSSISKETKLIIFLEKLEHSKGMLNFIQPLSWPTNKAFSLIPDKEICSLTGILDIYKKK